MTMNMNKKLIALASATLAVLVSNVALASGVVYEARCFNPAEQDLDRCRVSVNPEAGTLGIHFRSDEDSVSDRVLQREQILGVSAGDFRRKPGVLASVLFGARGQDRVRFVVEYVDEQGNSQDTLVDVEREFSRYLESDLEQLINQPLAAE